jgi:hypothetical protein
MEMPNNHHFEDGIKKVCKKIEKKVFYDKIKNHRRLFIIYMNKGGCV